MPKPYFVTGGCGFVGRHMVGRLLQDGHDVWILDNLSVGKNPAEWLPEGFKYVKQAFNVAYFHNGQQEVVFIQDDALHFFTGQLKLGQAQSLVEVPAFADVFHFAAVVGGRAVKIAEDPLAVAIDLAIDSLFFRWVVANKDKVERVLYTSSSAAYPVNLQTHEKALALKEEFIEFGDNLGMPDVIYGWSKLTGEYLAQLTARGYGIHIACIRPFSGYGGDQDQNYPVPAIARRVAKRENPVIVWGSGQQGRDFVHIDDSVEAMRHALNAISDGSGVNIGTGILTTFQQVAEQLAELAGYAPAIQPLIDKPEGVAQRYSDPTVMKKLLKWEPQVSLKEGLRRVLAEQEKMVAAQETQNQPTSGVSTSVMTAAPPGVSQPSAEVS